ncbi:MAG TPA: polymer-forming cytoskeletal protein [Anaerolineae bacterium]|nr:polymer-forming cytoskeletal protein [Anaerolineae bacterium]
MFGREKSQQKQQAAPMPSASNSGGAARSNIETVVGPTAHFKGSLSSDGGIRIDGIFEGQLQIAGNLIVGESGKVIADVSAQNVSVSGAVKGTIQAAGRLEILSTGRVWGDISVAAFLIDEGGFFRGQSIMPGEPDMPMLEQPGMASAIAGPVIDAE